MFVDVRIIHPLDFHTGFGTFLCQVEKHVAEWFRMMRKSSRANVVLAVLEKHGGVKTFGAFAKQVVVVDGRASFFQPIHSSLPEIRTGRADRELHRSSLPRRMRPQTARHRSLRRRSESACRFACFGHKHRIDLVSFA